MISPRVLNRLHDERRPSDGEIDLPSHQQSPEPLRHASGPAIGCSRRWR